MSSAIILSLAFLSQCMRPIQESIVLQIATCCPRFSNGYDACPQKRFVWAWASRSFVACLACLICDVVVGLPPPVPARAVLISKSVTPRQTCCNRTLATFLRDTVPRPRMLACRADGSRRSSDSCTWTAIVLLACSGPFRGATNPSG